MSKSRRTSDLVNAIFVNPDNSVNIHEGTQSPYFLLDTGAVVTPQQGMMFWDSDRQTVGVQMNGVEARLGQDNFWYVKNQTGSDILKGTVVMAVGALGASSRILVAPMVADGSVEEQFLLGITAEDILNGEDGFVMNIGKIRGINTTQYGTQAGQILYCDPAVPGGLTITQPQAPNLDIPIAFTVDYKSNGTLAVRTLPGYHLGELHDVQITTPATDQILRYNNNRWENWTPTYLTTTPTLDQVTTAGSTTTNAITVGGLTVDTNLIYTDSVNNRVGIGTTGLVPGILLTINGSVSIAAGQSLGLDPSANIYMVAASTQFRLYTGSIVALSIPNTGNVLIGTTTDAGYKLDVNGTVRSVKNKIDITPTTNTTALDIRGTGTPNDFFTVSNATGGANDVFLPIFFYKAATYGYNGGTNRYPSGVYGGGFVGAVDDSSYPSAIGAGAAMHFNSRTYANNGPLNNRYLFSWGSWLSTYMTMTAGGNLLIGTTTNSGEKLQINGSAKISGDVYAGGDFYQNGIQGYTGTFTIIQDAPNPPINVEVNGGIITNVT